MHCADPIRIIRALSGAATGVQQVDWVSPILSTMLAALSLRDKGATQRVTFAPSCESYALNIGLKGVLGGVTQPKPTMGESCGMSYSPLASLACHAEVEACNALVNGVLRRNLEKQAPAVVRQVGKIVGEMHDNVASHARGRGYSATQIYQPDRLEFAIADCGCGLLKNAKRADPRISTDADAIEWSLRKGTTSAPKLDPMAQRTAEDWDSNADGDAHQGMGLWQLRELVKRTSGQLWLLTGTAQYLLSQGKESTSVAPISWSGLALELEVPITYSEPIARDGEELDPLASELAI